MKKTYLKTFTTILILILTLLYCLQFTSLYNKTNSNSNYLTVYFIDVGQGDCILVNVNGYNLLIDSGPSSARKSLLGYLDKLSISKILFEEIAFLKAFLILLLIHFRSIVCHCLDRALYD